MACSLRCMPENSLASHFRTRVGGGWGLLKWPFSRQPGRPGRPRRALLRPPHFVCSIPELRDRMAPKNKKKSKVEKESRAPSPLRVSIAHHAPHRWRIAQLAPPACSARAAASFRGAGVVRLRVESDLSSTECTGSSRRCIPDPTLWPISIAIWRPVSLLRVAIGEKSNAGHDEVVVALRGSRCASQSSSNT